MVNGPYVTSIEGFDRPWRHLEAQVPALRVESLFGGGAHLAWGEVAARPTP